MIWGWKFGDFMRGKEKNWKGGAGAVKEVDGHLC